MTIATNDTNGIQSDKHYAIFVGTTLVPDGENRWRIAEMPLITGPYETDDEAYDGECGEVDEIVYGWALIDMIQTGNLKGVQVAYFPPNH
jgi:hypothetical protein